MGALASRQEQALPPILAVRGPEKQLEGRKRDMGRKRKKTFMESVESSVLNCILVPVWQEGGRKAFRWQGRKTVNRTKQGKNNGLTNERCGQAACANRRPANKQLTYPPPNSPASETKRSPRNHPAALPQEGLAHLGELKVAHDNYGLLGHCLESQLHLREGGRAQYQNQEDRESVRERKKN